MIQLGGTDDRRFGELRSAETAVPLPGPMIGEAMERAADKWVETTSSYRPRWACLGLWCELRDRADVFAAGLLVLELRQGDRIGIRHSTAPDGR